MAVNKSSGIALIVVLSLVSVIVAILSEILFQSEVSSRSSMGERDLMQAEISALNGVVFAKLLVSLHIQINDLFQKAASSNPTPPATGAPAGAMSDAIKTQISAIKQGMYSQLNGKEIYELLNGLPIGSESLDLVKDLSKAGIGAFDTQLMEALKNIPGYFVLHVSSENSKINVNGLSRSEFRNTTKSALLRLFSGETEAKFLDDKKIKPEELVENLNDYVSYTTALSHNKIAAYETLKFVHRAKEAPFDSLEELRRVPGFNDDEVFEVFSPYLTVWPMDVQKESIDINHAPIELLSNLFTRQNQSQSQTDIILDKLEKMRKDGTLITDNRDKTKLVALDDDLPGKDILSNLIGLESNVYRIDVEGFFNQRKRVYTIITQRSKKKAAKKEATPAPPPTTPPPTNPERTPSPAPTPPVDKSDNKTTLSDIYQRFY